MYIHIFNLASLIITRYYSHFLSCGRYFGLTTDLGVLGVHIQLMHGIRALVLQTPSQI